MLGEGPAFAINRSFGSAEENFSINFSKANTKFCLRFYYNPDNKYLFVNGTKFLNLKPIIKILTFQLNFVREAYLMDLVLVNLEKYL